MKMRFPLFAIAAASVFAACTSDKDLYDENYVQEVEKASYEQNFIKKFGNIDPKQDWNMAKEYSITVNANSSVKVYAPSEDGIFQLVADYATVNGSKKISFTAVEGTENVYVIDANGAVKTVNPNNGSVTFAASRAAIKDFPDLLKVDDAEHSNINGLNCNGDFEKYFSLLAKTLKFPVYYLRGLGNDKKGVDGFGVYYTDAQGGEHNVDVWQKDTNGTNDKNHSEVGGVMLDFSNCMLGGQDAVKWGLYINVDGKRIYDYDEVPGSVHGNNKKYFKAVVKETTKWGEDWLCVQFDIPGHDSSANNQNNIFVIPAKFVDVVDPAEFAWALACEDLGTTDDFDFNDVVISASYVTSDQPSKMKVTALAAGGTLEANVMYGTQLLGEIHAMLGEPGNFTMINTTTIDHDGKTVEVDVPAGFNLTTHMQDFYVIVNPGERQTIVRLPEDGVTGIAPQALCVPASWRWPLERKSIEVAYPQGREKTPGFIDWVRGNDKPQSWYIYPAEGQVINRK